MSKSIHKANGIFYDKNADRSLVMFIDKGVISIDLWSGEVNKHIANHLFNGNHSRLSTVQITMETGRTKVSA